LRFLIKFMVINNIYVINHLPKDVLSKNTNKYAIMKKTGWFFIMYTFNNINVCL